MEKETEVLSRLGTDCAYGIARMGDDKTNPDRISYLARALAGSLGERVAAKTIVLKSFVIFRNNQAALRASNPYALPFRSLECTATSSQPGGYDSKENPLRTNAVVIDLAAAFERKELHARIVITAAGTPVEFGGSPEIWEKAVDAALVDIVAQLVDQIEA